MKKMKMKTEDNDNDDERAISLVLAIIGFAIIGLSGFVLSVINIVRHFK